jgi:hypothetical protein
MKSQSYIPVSEARTAIRKVIAKGGSATVKVGDEFRCLQHFPSFDRPTRRLPWPFSKLQPFRFEITRQTFPLGEVIAGVQFPSKGPGGPKTRTEYNHKQIDEAIEVFLDGCKPDDDVGILIDARL